MVEPLTCLLKKDGFLWTSEAQGAFEELKQKMITILVLALPDFTKTFVIETDASGRGLGVVLMQDNRPIAFLSQSLSERGRSKSAYERKLIAIVLATKKWRHYILGRHFIVRTDQWSLQFLLEQQVMNEDQQRWICKLNGLDFEIQYKSGRDNSVADALSRKAKEPLLHAFSVMHTQGLENIEEEVHNDDKLKMIVQGLLLDPQFIAGYQVALLQKRIGFTSAFGVNYEVFQRISFVCHGGAFWVLSNL